jgi:hypothetical protein
LTIPKKGKPAAWQAQRVRISLVHHAVCKRLTTKVRKAMNINFDRGPQAASPPLFVEARR